MSSIHTLPSPLLLLVPLGFGVVVCTILRYVTGWATLARFYRLTQPFTGSATPFRSATLNWAAFNNCLILGADSTGLYVSVFFPFTLASPPLLIPWTDITATPKQGIFVPVIAFRFAQVPQLSWSVTENIGRELLTARPGVGWENSDRRLA